MKYLVALPFAALMMIVALVSVPWVFVFIGLLPIDEAEAKRLIESSPLWRFLDWVEQRNAA